MVDWEVMMMVIWVGGRALENSTNTITEAEELVTKMLVSTTGPGYSQELYTPQHIPWTPLSSWNWNS